MSTKTYHGITLWAVPRFHRSEAMRDKQDERPAGSGKLYQFFPIALKEDETMARAEPSASAHMADIHH